MTWYDITWACGDKTREDVQGSNARTRDWKARKLQERECPACWEAQRKRERDIENAEAAKQAAATGLPELTGTPSQITWATTIRGDALELLDLIGEAVSDTEPSAETYRALVEVYRRVYLGQLSASAWINRRDDDPVTRIGLWLPAAQRQELHEKHGTWRLPRHLLSQAGHAQLEKKYTR